MHGPPFGSCAFGLIAQRLCSVRLNQACTQVWAKKRTNFGRKIGPNLSEDLFFFFFFFFCSSPNFGRKIEPNHLILSDKLNYFLVEQFLFQFFVFLKFSEVPAPPPPFSKLCVRYCRQGMVWNGRRLFHISYWQFSSIPYSNPY